MDIIQQGLKLAINIGVFGELYEILFLKAKTNILRIVASFVGVTGLVFTSFVVISERG